MSVSELTLATRPVHTAAFVHFDFINELSSKPVMEPDGPTGIWFECNYDCNLIQMHVHPDDAYPACAIQIEKFSYFTGSSAVKQ